MANQTEKQVLEDGPLNLVVKLTGALDTSDVSLSPAIRLQDLSGDPRLTLVGLKLEKVQYSIGADLVVAVTWNGATPQQACVLTEAGEICFSPRAAPNRLAAGYDGDVNLATSGFIVGKPNGYTVVLHFVKKYI